MDDQITINVVKVDGTLVLSERFDLRESSNALFARLKWPLAHEDVKLAAGSAMVEGGKPLRHALEAAGIHLTHTRTDCTLTAVKQLGPQICSTFNAFAEVENDGSVTTWGEPLEGGWSDHVREQLTDVVYIYSNWQAFAAVKSDKRVITWGWHHDEHSDWVAEEWGIEFITSTSKAFAALKSNGYVITWGDPAEGGDSEGVRWDLYGGVQHIYSTTSAFAAVKHDGHLVTWGNPDKGGTALFFKIF